LIPTALVPRLPLLIPIPALIAAARPLTRLVVLLLLLSSPLLFS